MNVMNIIYWKSHAFEVIFVGLAVVGVYYWQQDSTDYRAFYYTIYHLVSRCDEQNVRHYEVKKKSDRSSSSNPI